MLSVKKNCSSEMSNHLVISRLSGTERMSSLINRRREKDEGKEIIVTSCKYTG